MKLGKLEFDLSFVLMKNASQPVVHLFHLSAQIEGQQLSEAVPLTNLAVPLDPSGVHVRVRDQVRDVPVKLALFKHWPEVRVGSRVNGPFFGGLWI